MTAAAGAHQPATAVEADLRALSEQETVRGSRHSLRRTGHQRRQRRMVRSTARSCRSRRARGPMPLVTRRRRCVDPEMPLAAHGLACRVAQQTCQARQSAAGSDSGSPWTRTRSAGPPSRMTPASGSPRSSPPRQVAERQRLPRLAGPASTSCSTSQASWFARVDPPPKSVPVAIETPARWAMPHRLHRPLASRLRPRAPLVRREPRERRGPPERLPRGQHAQRRHEPDAVGGHDRGGRLVELEAVLERVDAGLGAGPRPGRVAAVGGDPGAARVDGLDDAAAARRPSTG